MPKEESKYKTRIPVVSPGPAHSTLSERWYSTVCCLLCPLQPRVKQIMQSDNQVGKIAQVTPHLICQWPLHSTPARTGLHCGACDQPKDTPTGPFN